MTWCKAWGGDVWHRVLRRTYDMDAETTCGKTFRECDIAAFSPNRPTKSAGPAFAPPKVCKRCDVSRKESVDGDEG